MTTTIYGLRCHGQAKYFSGSARSIFCGSVFRSRAAAEAYMPEFIRKCCESDGAESINDLDPDYVKCTVVEYELHDD